jgi:3-oxocholest-4-en-26-oyl-CoA dehydrogenase beta subunit
MNFDLSEEQQVVADLGEQIFGDLATVDRIKAAEAGDGIDHDLWSELAKAGLLSLFLPAAYGGSEMGIVEVALIAEAQGRHVAPVPFVSTAVAAMTIAKFGSPELQATLLGGVADGSVILGVALAERGTNDPLHSSVTAMTSESGTTRVVGTKPAVPAAQHATAILVPARRADGSNVIAVLTADQLDVENASGTDRQPIAHISFDTDVDAPHLIDDPVATQWLFEHMIVAIAASQLGVSAGAVRYAADHVATRQQFGKPLSSFQAVTQRAADAYITTEAQRSTVLNAAWRLGAGLDASRDVLVTAYWAGEGAQQVVLAAQHLHGGMGADVDHPVHRHFLWGMQHADLLGTTSAHLARLGKIIQSTAGRA